MRPDFDKCEKTATRLLLNQSIDNLFIDVKSLSYDKTIFFDSIQNYCRITKTPLSKFINNEVLCDGCTIIKKDIYIVLYNNNGCNSYRLNWTLAHEVGHIYLGHTCDERTEEIEAHYFAAQLLMPEIVILDLAIQRHGINAEQISDYFHVSYTAACKRVDTINNKYKHCKDFEEQQLLQKFKRFEPRPYNISFAM